METQANKIKKRIEHEFKWLSQCLKLGMSQANLNLAESILLSDVDLILKDKELDSNTDCSWK